MKNKFQLIYLIKSLINFRMEEQLLLHVNIDDNTNYNNIERNDLINIFSDLFEKSDMPKTNFSSSFTSDKKSEPRKHRKN